MKLRIVVFLGAIAVWPALGPAQTDGPVKAAGAIELKDAAGDMGPISTSSGSEPALDVVALAIRSDGTRLTFTATLNGPPGRFATAPVTVLIDTDNNPATGIKGFMPRDPSGFEYKALLALCIKYSDGAEACAGASTGGKPTQHYAAMDLNRFTGTSEFGGSEGVVDSMGFQGKKASVRVPVKGQVIEASIEYADLKVKPGQTIRLLAKESGGAPKDGNGAFPIVLLTLK